MEATLSGEAYAKVDDGDAATQARTTLVQRVAQSGQVGWGTITAKISQSITPDLDNATAAGLAASLLVQVVLMTIKLSSRANPAPGVHMCPSELGRPIPVQNTSLQNSCDAVSWIVAIVRNLWVVRHVATTHPVEMRAAFKMPSLVYHSLLGNTSPFVLEIVAYAVIGFFFKTMAFKSDDGAETCSSPGGTWEA